MASHVSPLFYFGSGMEDIPASKTLHNSVRPVSRGISLLFSSVSIEPAMQLYTVNAVTKGGL